LQHHGLDGAGDDAATPLRRVGLAERNTKLDDAGARGPATRELRGMDGERARRMSQDQDGGFVVRGLDVDGHDGQRGGAALSRLGGERDLELLVDRQVRRLEKLRWNRLALTGSSHGAGHRSRDFANDQRLALGPRDLHAGTFPGGTLTMTETPT